MILYEKVTSPAGRVSYKEYNPGKEPTEDMKIESEEVITILTTLTISMLMCIEQQLAPHMKLSRETKLLEQAVLRYATLNGAKLKPELINVGVEAWNASVAAIQTGLQRIQA